MPTGRSRKGARRRCTDYLVKAGLPANRFTPVGYGADPAARRQRDRRRQGAEPPHRFRGEVTMALSGDILLGLAAGVASARPRRWAGSPWFTAARAVSKNHGAMAPRALPSALVAASLTRGCAGPLRLLARPGPGHVRALSLRLRRGIVVARLGGVAQHRRHPEILQCAAPSKSGLFVHSCGRGNAAKLCTRCHEYSLIC